jgi:outer membrane immunogenic protein
MATVFGAFAMNRLVACVAAIAALIIGAPAFAADMPVKAPPKPVAPAPVYSWTGWYVGLNAGYSWMQDNSVGSVGTPIFANP